MSAPAFRQATTAEEANEILAECNRNNFERSHLLPASHITICTSGLAQVFWHGQPCGREEGFAYAIGRAQTHGVQTELVWMAKEGRWRDISELR